MIGLEQRAWFRHKAVGDPFPPRAFFSANTLPNNRGVIFGGQVVVDGLLERSDDVFTVTVQHKDKTVSAYLFIKKCNLSLCCFNSLLKRKSSLCQAPHGLLNDTIMLLQS